MKYIISLFVILSVYSCNSIDKFINVTYITGDIETSVSITCMKMRERSNKMKIDTIVYITEKEFDDIVGLMKSCRKSGNGCDSRIYIKYDSLEVCLGDPYLGCVCDIDENVINNYNTWTVKE